MARKAQGEWTQVSSLVGRIGLSISGKAWTDKNGRQYPAIEKVEGLVAEISFESEADKMYQALCAARVTVQGMLKNYVWEHGRLPVQPGKPFKVASDGKMDLPNTFYMDKIAAQAAGEGLDAYAVERLKAIIATAELKLQAKPVDMSTVADATDQGDESDDDDEEVFKYPAGTLDKTVIAKLKVLAQNEELEGYDELTADEIREELYAIEA